MRKTCRAGKRAGKYFYRILAAIFWMSLIFTAGYGWYYAKHQIPEHFSVAENMLSDNLKKIVENSEDIDVPALMNVTNEILEKDYVVKLSYF